MMVSTLIWRMMVLRIYAKVALRLWNGFHRSQQQQHKSSMCGPKENTNLAGRIGEVRIAEQENSYQNCGGAVFVCSVHCCVCVSRRGKGAQIYRRDGKTRRGHTKREPRQNMQEKE